MQDFGREIYSHFPSEILHNLQYFPIFALFCGHISGVWQNNKGGGEKSGDGRAETEQVGDGRVETEQEVRRREEERKYWE
ncbi:hypothetical protein B5G16_01540 [Alistipes sp. An66]|nr:hypothetical protein B5G16_01540 [Alistipes sp. An66]